MIGSRIGSQSAALLGSAVGSVSDDEGGITYVSQIPGVTIDSKSGRYVPASSTEWTALMTFAGLATGNPTALWLCQEASGSPADSIGALTLTPAGGPSYQTAAAGWARKGLSTANNSTQRFSLAAGVGPLPTTTSSLWIWYVAPTSTPTSGTVVCFAGGSGDSTYLRLQVSTTPVAGIRCIGSTTNGTSNPVGPAARPFVLKYDRTNSSAVCYTNQDKITGVYSAGVSDNIKGIGWDGATNSIAATYVYGVMFSGAAAELTDAQVKTLLTALGWTIPWS